VNELRIDPKKLAELLRQGKSQAECARHFGVSDAAIHKARKKINLNVVKNVALENAHRVVNKNLDAISQLQKINEFANELLDQLMRWTRGDGEEVQFVTEYKMRDPRELALKAMAEIRGQISMQVEILQTFCNMKAVEEFQQEVLEAIGSVTPELRNRIIQRLKEKSTLRPSATIS
jgi:hypothetical protein